MMITQKLPFVALYTAIVLTTAACSDGNKPVTPESNPPAASAVMASNAVTQLEKKDRQVGTGAEAVAGKTVAVHYTGWLYDAAAADHKGAKFDSSLDRKTAFEFPLGGGMVIAGWDQGVVGMKVGGQRTLIIPAEMGYGQRGAGGVIPPNATLVFDVELLAVK